MLVSHDSAIEAARADVRVRRALVSVFDKQQLIELAGALDGLGIEILSTGGTAEQIDAAGLPVTTIESLTGFPEILDGRVKTLHPVVHGGILFQRAVPEHQAQIEANQIRGIDLVIVNLYPFSAARERAADWPELVEHIDIGGPAMARAAAKNFPYVAVVTDPHQYGPILDELRRRDGALSGATRARLARQAFELLSRYDATVATSLAELGLEGETEPIAGAADAATPSTAPPRLELAEPQVQALRYGENPHQQAAFYAAGGSLPGLTVHQGKELSYNNILDLDACLVGLREFGRGTCLIFKHASPSGIALGPTPLECFRAARDADALSAFGGIIGFTEAIDAEAAAEVARDFYEVVVAPGFSPAARTALARKRNLRVIEMAPELLAPPARPWTVRSALGGFLLQSLDSCGGGAFGAGQSTVPSELVAGRTVTQRAPSAAELAALEFVWRCTRLVRSNAIVLANHQHTVGIGGGQASRIDSVEVAALKAARAGNDTEGSVMGSDAFFPFRDCVDAAARLGVTGIVQPGGSRRDQESIEAADEHGMAMVFTGRRHFLH